VTVAGARLSTTPIIVPVLVGLNVLGYVVTAAQAGGFDNFRSPLFDEWSLWPPPVAAGQWWRLVTSGFLHIGVTHLLVNMIALWVLGRDLEIVLGRLRFTSVYLLSLLGGSTAVFLFGDLGNPVAGASGAVYGLMGGIAIAAFRLKLDLKPVLLVIGFNIALSVALPGISLLGHLGGLVVGFAATAALLYAPASRRNAWQAGVLVALFVVLMALLVTRDAQFGAISCFGSGDQTRCVQQPG
jgi:membrane associated rhomboid family serine protease